MQAVSTVQSSATGDSPADASPSHVTREERVRKLAYAASERRGFVMGFEVEDWLEAEKQVDLEDQGAGSSDT